MTNLSHTPRNLANNESEMSTEELASVLQEAELSESILPTESHLDSSVSKSNGDVPSVGVKGNFENSHPALALVNSLKADLEQAGDLAKPETHEKILQLEKWAQSLENGAKRPLNVATEEQLKRDRQWLLKLAALLRRASDLDLDTLLRTTVTEVREHLQVDRALIYCFQAENVGTVLAESVVSGYTPSLGESLPAIAFGAQTQQDYQQQQIIALEHVYQKTRSAHQLQLMQRFQVKASLSLPIFVDGIVWGLLVVQQCSGVSRRWQETEVNLLCQVVSELKINLQPTEFRNQQRKQIEQNKVVGKVTA